MNEQEFQVIVDHVENLKSEDFTKRNEAVKNLHVVAQIFGPVKTRSTLLPFLKEFKDDEKEIMLSLARQFKFLGDLICQQEIHLAELVPYFYLCLNYEDLEVIETAISSLKYLVEKYKFKHESIIALSKKLFQTKYTKSIISSVRLCCELAEYIPSKYGGELNKIVTDTSNSEVPIIRRFAAYSLRFIIKEKCPFVQLATQCLKKLISDPQDTVKVFATQTLAYHKHSKTFFMKNIFPLITNILEEKSWRVQFAFLENFENVILSVQSTNKKGLMDFYLACMKSSEEEVVIISFKILKSISSHLDPDFIIQKILPHIEDLSKTEQVEVRKSIASSLPYLAPSIGKNNANKKLKDLILEFLKDQDNMVKIEVFKNLEPLDSVISIQQLIIQVQDTLKDLLNENNWVIREEAVQTLKIIFEKLDEENNRNPEFLKYFTSKLQDRVYQVRKTTIQVIKQLCQSLGQKWAENQALEIFNEFYKNPNYLYRLNYLFGISQIYLYLSQEALEKEINNTCKLVKDPVPNDFIDNLHSEKESDFGRQIDQNCQLFGKRQ